MYYYTPAGFCSDLYRRSSRVSIAQVLSAKHVSLRSSSFFTVAQWCDPLELDYGGGLGPWVRGRGSVTAPWYRHDIVRPSPAEQHSWLSRRTVQRLWEPGQWLSYPSE